MVDGNDDLCILILLIFQLSLQLQKMFLTFYFPSVIVDREIKVFSYVEYNNCLLFPVVLVICDGSD